MKLCRVESRMVWIERYREEKKEDRKPVPAVLAIPEENNACTVSTELEYEYDDILDYILGTEPSVDSNNIATCTSAKEEGKLEAQSQEKDDGDVDRTVEKRKDDNEKIEKQDDNSDESDDDEDEMMNDTSDDSKSDDNNDHEMKSDTSDNSDDSERDNETSSSESDDDNGDDGHQQRDVRPQANRDERRRNDVREDLKALEELVRQQSTMINVTLNGMFHEMRTQTELLRQIRDISRSPLRRNAGVKSQKQKEKGMIGKWWTKEIRSRKEERMKKRAMQDED